MNIAFPCITCETDYHSKRGQSMSGKMAHSSNKQTKPSNGKMNSQALFRRLNSPLSRRITPLLHHSG